MDRRRRFLLQAIASLAAAAWLGAACLGDPLAQVAPAHVLSGPALLDALHRGGLVLYFRHAETDFGQNDDAMTSFNDCSRQRNLTDTGRAHARAIGHSFATLRIPVGDVLVSPYCRTRETAQLIFGRATVSMAVRGGPPSDRARYAELEKLLSQPVDGGVNRVIVSHGNPFHAVTGSAYLAEGEAAVIEPRGNDGFRVVGRVKWDGWEALTR